jgi:hypothetical protein
MANVRAFAQRLITTISERAFAELARERGELMPMALTMDANGRIGMVAVYTGDTYPDPDLALADLMTSLKTHVERNALESAALAHYECITGDAGAPARDAVCVRYETRHAAPLRIYFPFQIQRKLSGPSPITRLPPVTCAGTHAIFARDRGESVDR